jgi:D-alanyl-D-alanine carboxypeptidase (penicillin-binding protein 5/6)
VLTANNKDKSWQADNAGNRLCAEIGLAVYNHFARDHAGQRESFPTTLARGSSGKMVEALQRTLNARSDPSPDLSVDGDFGHATEEAVEQFQRKSGLATTGQVGPETWEELGQLILEDPPAPDPSVVNSRTLEISPPDPLDGPPFVTCKAWAIADGQTGKVLWGEAADAPLEVASTTKIMSGYLICRLAEHEPEILEEMVTVSTRADETRGSTAGLIAGERLPAGELLYGLMLPSGNDAAVALAEHFGGRVARGYKTQADSAPHEEATPQARYDAFIAAMNHEAQELCLANTAFKNPHGMTTEGHVATCRDLLTLAHAALKNELFRKVVATRERGASVTGASGYRRNLLWTNTNRLLPIEGYLGIKTGTTDSAGACLVSAATRGERTLLVCVLGAAGADARYVDTRNLYRWAWKKREE